jgi:DNA-binding IclR family transcriptional regulator
MNVSAAGIATLAAMPKQKRWSTLLRLRTEMEQRNEDARALEHALEACYRLGYAMVRNTWHEGIGGVSVPILWQGTYGALAMPVPTNTVSAQRMHNELAPILLACAADIGLAPLQTPEY